LTILGNEFIITIKLISFNPSPKNTIFWAIFIRLFLTFNISEVDQIIGEQELVIRPLGNANAPPKYTYGCSSLANGTLILVIDPTLLLESYEMQATLESTALPTAYAANKKALPLSGLTFNSTPLLTPSTDTNTTQTQQSHSVVPNNKSPKVVVVVDDAISLR
jgi:chemotaxis family two-component system sensor histidine kinase/response regulator PixL